LKDNGTVPVIPDVCPPGSSCGTVNVIDEPVIVLDTNITNITDPIVVPVPDPVPIIETFDNETCFTH